jgi:hypothetical protein
MKKALFTLSVAALIACPITAQAQELGGGAPSGSGSGSENNDDRYQLIAAIQSVRVMGTLDEAYVFVDAGKFGGVIIYSTDETIAGGQESALYVSPQERLAVIELFDSNDASIIPIFDDVRDALLADDYDLLAELIWANLLVSNPYGADTERLDSVPLVGGVNRAVSTPFGLKDRLKKLIKEAFGADGPKVDPDAVNEMVNKGKGVLQKEGINPNDLRKVIPPTQQQVDAILKENARRKKAYEDAVKDWEKGGQVGPKPKLDLLPEPDLQGLKPKMNAGGVIDPNSRASVIVDAPHPPKKPGDPNIHGPGQKAPHVHVIDSTGNRIATIFPLPAGPGGKPRSVTIREGDPRLKELIELGKAGKDKEMNALLEKIAKENGKK